MPTDIKYVTSILCSFRVVKQKVVVVKGGSIVKLWLKNKYWERFTEIYDKFIEWVNVQHYYFYFKGNILKKKGKQYYINGEKVKITFNHLEVYRVFKSRLLWNKYINRSSVFVRLEYIDSKIVTQILEFYESKQVFKTLLKVDLNNEHNIK